MWIIVESCRSSRCQRRGCWTSSGDSCNRDVSGKMAPKETTHLLTNPVSEITRINIPEKYIARELTKEDLKYYTVDPLWIKIRLFLFWSFWMAFLVVLFLSILIYVFPSMC